jgi:protein-S-isoprenylcysteine O-methyltransferase Ste14
MEPSPTTRLGTALERTGQIIFGVAFLGLFVGGTSLQMFTSMDKSSAEFWGVVIAVAALLIGAGAICVGEYCFDEEQP